jgi:hypothetical protein
MSESALIMPLAVLLLLALAGASGHPTGAAPGSHHRSYVTRFPLAEDPISEGGQWVNGRKEGLDWADVCTRAGLAYGTEPGTVKYDDSTALLTGAWEPDQMAEATVHATNQNAKIFEEVELRLRSSLSAHRATGYEILFRCLKTEEAYLEIVRWNGPLGDFTYLNRGRGSRYGVADGDVVRATVIGDMITAYINGVPMLQATDDTYASDSPGMGFYLEGASGVNSDYGFTSFLASDEPARLAGAEAAALER